MKKIVNSRLYDTDTAEMVGSYTNGFPPSDFNYCGEKLYRKKNGEYFIHGEGGPMTRYSVMTGQNSWSDGEDIVPLSEGGARRWAEKRLTVDEYVSIFGEVAE